MASGDDDEPCEREADGELLLPEVRCVTCSGPVELDEATGWARCPVCKIDMLIVERD